MFDRVAEPCPCAIEPPTAPTPRRLPWSDHVLSLALRVFVFLVGYRVRRATTAEDIEAACRLRRCIYDDDIGRTAGPGGGDRYDDRAHHLVALHRGRVVGTMRLLSSPGPSVLRDAAHVRMPDEPVFELSGLAIDRAHRGRGRAVFVGLLDCAYRLSAREGRSGWVSLFHRKQMRAFSAFNSAVTPVEMRPRRRPRLPEHMAERIMRRGDDYRCVLFDLRAVSYVDNIVRMVRGTLRARRQRR